MQKISKKRITTLMIFLIIVSSIQCSAQMVNIAEKTKYTRSIESFRMAINSDYEDLKKSAIQLTGFYKISENVPLLILKFREEKNQEMKDLIALSIYMIGDKKALEEINIDYENVINENTLKMLGEIYKLQFEKKLMNLNLNQKIVNYY